MKQSFIHELTDTEVVEKLIEERGNYVRLKSNHAVSPIENPMKIRSTRKTIARLETEVKKRNLSTKTK